MAPNRVRIVRSSLKGSTYAKLCFYLKKCKQMHNVVRLISKAIFTSMTRGRTLKTIKCHSFQFTMGNVQKIGKLVSHEATRKHM